MKRILLGILISFSTIAVAQVPSYVPQNGLKCYYPFSGNTNDVSPAASHLTNSGAVLTTDRFGATASAYSFNGSNQSMSTLTPNFTLTSSGSFTFSVWIEKTSTSSGVALINGTTTAGNFIWLLQGGGASMTYGTNKQQQAWVYISAPVVTNVWEHYVGVYNNGAMTFYKNNVVESTGTFTYTGVTSANMPFYVGKGISGGFFTGKIDDLGVWDRALTACEINDLFNSSNTLSGLNAGADQTICSGQSVTLSGSGATTYLWDNGVSDGISFTPSSTQTYTVTGMDGAGCSAWDQVNVTLQPTTLNGGLDTTLCDGASLTLNGTGGTGLSWDNGVQNGVSFVPTSTTTYTLSGLDNNGCSSTDQVLVTLYQPPINAGADVSICQNVALTLNATGGATYVWDNGVANGSSFLPINSGFYSVTGTDVAGCSKTDSLEITIIPAANIQAGPDINACVGDFVTLSGSGGLFYTWNNGVFNNAAFIVNSTNTYIVTGADSSNCFNSDTITVFVNPPTSSTLTINAIDQYDLNGSIYSTSGTYTQVVQNAAGCDSTITMVLNLDFTSIEELEKTLITVYPNPTNDILMLQSDASLIGKTLRVYSTDGKEMKLFMIRSELNQMNVSELSPGVYIGNLDEHPAIVFRIVKN